MIRSLRPISVSTNLLLAMLGTIVIAQVITGALFYAQSQETKVYWSAFFWAQRVSDLLTSLDVLGAGERREVIGRLLPDRRLAKAPDSNSRWSAQDTEFSKSFRDRIGTLLPQRGAIQITPASDADGPADGYLSVLADFPPKSDLRLYDVHLGFNDGTYAKLRLQQVDRDIPQPSSWFIYPLVLITALISGALFIARSITGPLSTMARAAEALGRGAAQPILAETGPRELRLAARAFNTMQDRLHRYLDSRTRVLTAMSHDLNTPITRMMLRTEALSEPSVKEPFARDLQEMREMVSGALDMLKGLGTGESLHLVDVNALLAALQSDFADLGFNVAVSGHVARPLLAQPLGLRRLLANLLDNARKYANQAQVTVVEANVGVIFRVIDDGPGIPADKLEQVMEPYFRLDASRARSTGGMGLGLSIARDIAQSHGGHLELQNGEVSGLTAVVTIPR